MEDNFNQNDFEEFLKEQVRNHRMYPNDAVWRDINTKLHGDKKWPALTIAAFALLSATITICVYFTPKPDIFTVNPSKHELNNSTFLNSQHTAGLDNLSSSASLSKEKVASDYADNNQSLVAEVSPAILDRNFIKINNENRIVSSGDKEDNKVITTASNDVAVENKSDQKLSQSSLDPGSEKELLKSDESMHSPVGFEKIITSHSIKPLGDNKKIIRDDNDKDLVDNFLKDHKEDVSLHTAPKIKSVKNKFSIQVYVAPSISYRKLLEDKSVLREGANSGPVGLNYVADVNKVVRHKPGNGLEAGVSILYNLSNKFRVKSGLQFNVRQYSIEAYRSSAEVASIELVENNRIDTVVTTLAIYRNSNGYSAAELVNRYYQIAIPIGVEWEITGNKRIQLNVAGTIQPTYLINRNAYLLSTNFKNYSEKPDLVRPFNINSNIETYISFKAGDFKWQIGPQLRYQPYSTFVPQYPIKEHLLDYGIKFGLSKTF